MLIFEEAQALSALSEGICLAEPEGYIRSFVDEGTRWRLCSIGSANATAKAAIHRGELSISITEHARRQKELETLKSFLSQTNRDFQAL